jgi:hypothetical protein
MIIEQVLDTIEIPCERWILRNNEEILPVVGTWTLTTEIGWELGAKGILSCPNCGYPCYILHGMGVKAEDVPINQVIENWMCRSCHLLCRIILLEWDKRRLYCAAYETMGGDGKVIANKEYMHAESESEARVQFWNGRIAADNVIRLVAVGPVIGYFVQDKTGGKLNVD